MQLRMGTRHGFTLIEMMIVVAIIGILSAVAIPSFVKYQNTSKRAEAYANLSALAKAQKSYFAEFNSYVLVVSEPLGLTGLAPGPTKRDSTGWDGTNFASVGWRPEGDVFYDYDTNAPAAMGTCPCTACFTAGAYGDLEGDGMVAVLLYASPDLTGASWCPTALVPNDPPLVGGSRQFNQVVRVPVGPGSDDF